MSTTIFDIVILTIISISTLLGLYRGMFQVLISSICFIATIFVTAWIYPKVRIIFVSYFDNELIIAIISGISSYIFSLLVFTFIASSLRIMVSPLSQNVLDRILGGFIGFIRGTLISVVLFSFAALYASGSFSHSSSLKEKICRLPSENYPQWLKNSITSPPLESLLRGMVKIIPEGLLDDLNLLNSKNHEDEEFIKELKRKANEFESPKEVDLNED